jgi:4-amino-4-deoxy-L-arabinose transferase-like glycosyltransferase
MKFLGSTKSVVLSVAAIALALNFGLGLAMGLSDPLEGDAYYYYQLADSLSEGNGYVVRDGFWPEDSSMRRMPGWPFIASVAMRLMPFAPEAGVMRWLCLLLNAASPVLVALVALRLFRNNAIGLLSGLACAVHPSGLLAAQEGLSEPAFVTLTAAGALLLMNGLGAFRASCTSGSTRPSGRAWAAALFGFLLLGLACLVRANFVLWIGFFGIAAGCFALRRRSVPMLALLAIGGLLFVTPPLLWAVRNHGICGHFPVFSALRGQTFYGGNNDIVANDKTYWGYWVFPNAIPGETPMVTLAQSMSEYDVDVYYNDRGKAWISAHKSDMPTLLLGKLIRAYVPISWSRSLPSYAMNGFRAIYIGLAALGFVLMWRKVDRGYFEIVAGMILTSVVTVLMFYGYSRFAYAVEAFLAPFIGCAVVVVLSRFRSVSDARANVS